MNPLYEQMNRNDIVSQFNLFKRSFNGNPQQMIQQMLNSGRITQTQLDQAIQQANRLKNMFGIR